MHTYLYVLVTTGLLVLVLNLNKMPLLLHAAEANMTDELLHNAPPDLEVNGPLLCLVRRTGELWHSSLLRRSFCAEDDS